MTRITLISTDGHDTEISGELVGEYPGSFEVRLSPGATVNVFDSDEWKLKPAPLPTEPGSWIRATIRGVENMEAMRSDDTGWITYIPVGGARWHAKRHIDLSTVVLGRIVWDDEVKS